MSQTSKHRYHIGARCSCCHYCFNECPAQAIKFVGTSYEIDEAKCIQCGKCAKVCENEAITQNPKTGVYMINRKKCVSCGKCVEVCPMKVMVLKPENPASKCISCGACVKACPMGVLEIVEK